ncbi:hypothetical protein GO986_12480 [Deinococcus sp. HMF7620]|uniref:Uncharacterized protein n=1 Tax=Deinococcus arboris TaxID=2682977 RepID=A0A7C9M9C0_9DEIO|nr:hypothetical protein [Deinococcus arboris]MVN87583.1 hypothetical protein [Deinococcus arboris]
MTRTLAADHPLRTRALKLLQLARRGVGGERSNAARLLLTHLQTHDLTLYDIDPGLPVTQDLSVLASIREAQLYLAKLGTDEQDEALGHLVDDPSLTAAEIARVVEVLDLTLLAQTRAATWAHLDGADEQAYLGAAAQVTPAALSDFGGSIAARTHEAVRQALWLATHPQRLLRVQGELEQLLVSGLLAGLGARRIQTTPEGVQAHLSGEQLALVRSMMVHDLEPLKRQLLEAGKVLAEQHARRRVPQ